MGVDNRSMSAEPNTSQSSALLYFASALNGTATLLLGPILPLLARRWGLDDAHLGYLPMAQFCGAFLGGVSTTGRLRTGALLGLSLACVGLCVFAGAPGLPIACLGLLLTGFGVGRSITTLNLLAGRSAPERRTLALSRLNLFWSLGALLSPLLAAWLTPHVALPVLLGGLAGLFLIAALLYAMQPRVIFGDAAADLPAEAGATPLHGSVLTLYIAQLFVYGGLETCLAVWLTTFALRYGGDSMALSEYTTVLLLAGLTVGRALSPPLLRRLSDSRLQGAALVLSAVVTAALLFAHGMAAIATLAVLLGLALSPVFPSTFARLMAFAPPARSAGVILAASGLGAAGFPWMMGQLSTRAGGLQTALAVPIAAAVAMLVLTVLPLSSPEPLPSGRVG